MQYRFKGPGKYIVGGGGGRTRAVKPGDVIELEKTPAGVWAAKFEPVGPTLEEFVNAGYAPENYPPSGYAEEPSEGLTTFRESQREQKAIPDQTETELPDLSAEKQDAPFELVERKGFFARLTGE